MKLTNMFHHFGDVHCANASNVCSCACQLCILIRPMSPTLCIFLWLVSFVLCNKKHETISETIFFRTPQFPQRSEPNVVSFYYW